LKRSYPSLPIGKYCSKVLKKGTKGNRSMR
jgi:hypothetical protein